MQTSHASSGAATKIKPRTDPWINFILPIARHQSVAQRQTVCELTVMRKCSVMFRTSVITSNLSEKTEISQATQRIALRTYRARRLPTTSNLSETGQEITRNWRIACVMRAVCSTLPASIHSKNRQKQSKNAPFAASPFRVGQCYDVCHFRIVISGFWIEMQTSGVSQFWLKVRRRSLKF